MHARARRSLATRIVALVLLATLLTAGVVSGLGIHAGYILLRDGIGARLERTLDTTAAALDRADAGDPRGALAAVLATRTGPADAEPVGVRLVDSSGGVHAQAGAPAAGPCRARVPADGTPGATRLRTYRCGDARWIGVATPLAGGRRLLVAEQPLRAALAPLAAVAARVLLADLVVLLLFAMVARRIAGSVVEPLHALGDAARRISRGELDVAVPEPTQDDELALLTRTFNEMSRDLARQRDAIDAGAAALRDRNHQLQQVNEVLEQLSITDGLTKLHNHRFFQDHLTREIKRCDRSREPLSMLLLDIDDFKRLNDRLGHAAGDELLVAVGRILNAGVRAADFVARYGGEEFVVVAPATDLEGARTLAEKIRTEVAEASFVARDSRQSAKITVSIGVAQYGGNRRSFFVAADQALYRAKAAGKNCVMADSDELDLPTFA